MKVFFVVIIDGQGKCGGGVCDVDSAENLSKLGLVELLAAGRLCSQSVI